jgi:hypothetical protein
MLPIRLTSITRRSVGRSSASNRVMRPVVPALLTSAVTGPKARSVWSNRCTTPSGTATSALTATARPPAAAIRPTTDAAACSSRM